VALDGDNDVRVALQECGLSLERGLGLGRKIVAIQCELDAVTDWGKSIRSSS
jgi:hypothetical protein